MVKTEKVVTTYHVGVGDLGQQLHQGIASERAHFLILLQPTDGSAHTSSRNHRWRVHGELEICENKRQKIRACTGRAGIQELPSLKMLRNRMGWVSCTSDPNPTGPTSRDFPAQVTLPLLSNPRHTNHLRSTFAPSSDG